MAPAISNTGDYSGINTCFSAHTVKQHCIALTNRGSINQSAIRRELYLIVHSPQIIVIISYMAADIVIYRLDLLYLAQGSQV